MEQAGLHHRWRTVWPVKWMGDRSRRGRSGRREVVRTFDDAIDGPDVSSRSPVELRGKLIELEGVVKQGIRSFQLEIQGQQSPKNRRGSMNVHKGRATQPTLRQGGRHTPP